MFCKYCGKQVSDDAIYCAMCGKKIGEASSSSVSANEQSQNQDLKPIEKKITKKNSVLSKIAGILIVIFFIGLRSVHHNSINSRARVSRAENLEKMKKEAEAQTQLGFAYGFMVRNIDAYETFCQKAGNVPEKYLSKTRHIFSTLYSEINRKLFNNTNYSQEWQSTKEVAMENSVKSIEDEYAALQVDEPSLTKSEFCKRIDDNADEVSMILVENFKKIKPNFAPLLILKK